MNLKIRDANDSDKISVLRFCKNTFSWGDYVEHVWDFWLSEGHLFLAEQGHSIGICHAFYSDDQIWIEGIRVDPNFRRQNIASKLVKQAEILGKEKNLSTSYMLIDTENLTSLSMANSLNYEIFQTWNFYSLEPKINLNHKVTFEKSLDRKLYPQYVKSWRWLPIDDKTLQSFYEHREATYSVAWIGCLANGKSFGRSILILGEHAQKKELHAGTALYPKKKNKRIRFPFDAPSFLLNNFTVSVFNKFYFNLNKNKQSSYVDWDTYFYPLDFIRNWNRIYGKKGFFQFQCVLPREVSEEGFAKMLSTIQRKSSGSFLAVLKDFGSGNGQLSFPKEGLTLALDFRASKKNIDVGKELADIVNNLGGDFYLAKDAILDASQFNLFFDKDEFLKYRNKAINSEQSIRIKL